MQVLRMAPFEDINHAVELEIVHMSNARQKKIWICLWAHKDILVLHKTYGKGECMNLFVFRETIYAKQSVVYAKHVTQMVCQRREWSSPIRGHVPLLRRP